MNCQEGLGKENGSQWKQPVATIIPCLSFSGKKILHKILSLPQCTCNSETRKNAWNFGSCSTLKANKPRNEIDNILLITFNHHGETQTGLGDETACFDIHLQVLHRCCFLWCKLSAAKPQNSEFPASENIQETKTSGGTVGS